jgi:hypothetical protein
MFGQSKSDPLDTTLLDYFYLIRNGTKKFDLQDNIIDFKYILQTKNISTSTNIVYMIYPFFLL